jgi:hypothetical protein
MIGKALCILLVIAGQGTAQPAQPSRLASYEEVFRFIASQAGGGRTTTAHYDVVGDALVPRERK